MGIFKSMAGMVTLELISADIPGAMQGINALDVQIFDVQPQGDLSVRFGIYRKDFRAVSGFAAKRGERLEILRKKGIYWTVKGLIRRPVLVLGMAVLLFLAFFIPSRVYFVRVEGNESVPARLILEAAEESGIGFGASRRAVRSEKMKNALLSKVPELQWAGVNTYGCVAVISVRERSELSQEQKEQTVSSIVAARDGIIVSCTVTRGNGLCAVGQAVQAGQVLISGYTDCGLTITATRAEGEIMAQTHRQLEVITPSMQQIRGREQGQTTKYSLLVGKKRINFYKGSGISDSSCVKMYSEYVLTLPGGFQLPLALVRETAISYDLEAAPVDERSAQHALTDFASSYLRRQMVAGSITGRSEAVGSENGVYRLTGEYACIEMIGRVRQEQIGEYHGETD